MLARRVCELADVVSVQPVPRPVFSVTEAERAAARDAIATLDLAGGGPLVVLHPGAGTELKLWPPERWGRTLDFVRERWDARTLIVSTRAERPAVSAIQRAAELQSSASLHRPGPRISGRGARSGGNCSRIG